ncbi:MAG TPA: hypothetical protein EYQ47_04420 [Cycloclasticus sp.]|jgi:hypothetical protein|nr:hypothetical protein [Cycloclasticus sp.]
MDHILIKALPKIYLIIMGILSSWFLLQLAYADPRCANCSMSLVAWAMPRAELLVSGWIIAGLGAIGLHLSEITAYYKTLKGDNSQADG